LHERLEGFLPKISAGFLVFVNYGIGIFIFMSFVRIYLPFDSARFKKYSKKRMELVEFQSFWKFGAEAIFLTPRLYDHKGHRLFALACRYCRMVDRSGKYG